VDRGRAAAWMQAGNAGGVAVGGLGLLLAERFGLPSAAVAVAALLAACSLPLLGIRMPAWKGDDTGLRKAFRHLEVDLRGVFLSKNGFLALLLCVLPVGAGAASNIFAAIAGDWHAPPDLVATSNGLLAGAVSVAGCAVGGRLSDRMGRMAAYLTSGFLMAIPAFAMAIGPRTPLAYAAFVLAYYFVIGINYATFCGFALSVIGKGSAATKYNILASLANIPIYMMTRTDGWVSDHWGRTAMLWIDGSSEIVAGLVMLVAIVAVRRLGRLKPAGASETAA
jgi:PAT family beta-lactamase induction signal transducer AmpG